MLCARNNLLTPKSKDLLCTYINDTNAQKILSELHIYQTDSIVAQRRARECLAKILSSRMDPNQNREEQIVAFKDLLNIHDSYSKTTMGDDVKLSHLENIIYS